MSSPALLSRYSRLPELSGTAYLAATAVGRLPITMVPLAVLALVTSASGSVAVGGLASACAAVGEAVGVPVVGAFADRRGQRGALLTVVVLHLFAVASLFAALAGPAGWTVLAAAACVGLTLPSVSGFSRARWLRMTPCAEEQRTAFAFEGTVDEAAFILGPALVGIVGVLAGPAGALVVAAALVAVFVTAFACHRTHRVTAPRPAGHGGPRPRVPWAVAGPVAGMLAMGTVFGATQTGVTAAAEAGGSASAGSLVYAVMAIGSTVTTLCLVLVPERVDLPLRWLACGAGMLAGSGLLVAAAGHGLLALSGAVLVTGLFVGPGLVTISTTAAALVAAERGAFVMALLNSGIVLGVATGAAVGGALSESSGPAAGLAVVAGAAAVLTALPLPRLLRRGRARAQAPA